MNNKNKKKIGIIGGGAWGTALGSNLCQKNREVIIWSRNNEVVDSINLYNCNKIYLPEIVLNKNLKSTSKTEKFSNLDIIIFAVPTQFIRSTINLFKKNINKQSIIINTSKGIEKGSLLLPSEIFNHELPGSTIAVLSGPTFALDVAKNLPSAITLACSNKIPNFKIGKEISNPNFRIYHSKDVLGVEIGGALKNIIAIAAGIINGAKLGKNAHAALISRGLVEISRFGLAIGAQTKTIMGLSGLGDLVLTCNSDQSRNFSLGNAIGQGISVSDYLNNKKSVVEGFFTTESAVMLAEKFELDIPIIKAVNLILKEKQTLDETIKDFFSRPQKFENE